jgi:hypothetical protein
LDGAAHRRRTLVNRSVVITDEASAMHSFGDINETSTFHRLFFESLNEVVCPTELTSRPAATSELQVKLVELWAPVWFVDPIEVVFRPPPQHPHHTFQSITRR